ncbi:MAG TPA: malto-oligosyltrehalose synthase [Chloroflexia bacterium]|nr:malto-oligosyltrehalose synthase [Chloroflexia bacterium]
MSSTQPDVITNDLPQPQDEKEAGQHQELQASVDRLMSQVQELVEQRRHLPLSTYRLQFNKFFTFKQATEEAAYLNQLGISDLYASPYLRARAESLHGYDIVSHDELNPSIGTEQDYNQMVETLHRNGMYQILDTVPNHMGIGEPANKLWMDVLENGKSSLYATYFDIDWEPLNPKLTNKVLLPVLGEQYGRVLENGELQLRFEPAEGAFYLNYYDHVFPINPHSYLLILEGLRHEINQQLGDESDASLEFQSILTALSHLPGRNEDSREKILERNREKEIIKRRLVALCESEPRVLEVIQAAVTLINSGKDSADPEGKPHYNRLDALLEEQAYRLSFWRVASEEINYRRFFDVNDLAAVRVEVPEVFEEVHRFIFHMIGEGKINGLRIDHVDGLYDPPSYFINLQRRYFLELARICINQQADITEEQRPVIEKLLLDRFDQERSANPKGWLSRPLYVVIEKILGRGESLPQDWAVNGTTGYEFTNLVNGLFVDPANEQAFSEIYSDFTGENYKFSDLIYEKKMQIMRTSLASEITILTNMLNRISTADRYFRDFTVNGLRRAIMEVIASFPIYRTYTSREQPEVEKRDQNYVDMAVQRAKKRNAGVNPTVFDFLRDVLLLNYPDYMQDNADARERWLDFVLKFQQCSGPLMAKGLEDTAFYIYNRLISLNEVGGEPEYFGINLANFHRLQAERQNRWPYALLTTSTHDTKRSEDVRARINVLSELPAEWQAALRRWRKLNQTHKKTVDEQQAPNRNEEYLLYQTLLGVWPFETYASETGSLSEETRQELISRLQDYMRKALNEAKINSSWVNTNEPYLQAVSDFIAAILDPQKSREFLADFKRLQKKIAFYGAFNSLSQTLVKLTSPGVPDIYQGNEIWDFSMVDPDNRRPVDYDRRQSLLSEVSQIQPAPESLAKLVEGAALSDGRIKLYLTSRLLNYRQAHPDIFQESSYAPVEAHGPRQDNVCAYSRRLESANNSREILVVAPRLLTQLAGDEENKLTSLCGAAWAGTSLALPGREAGQQYRNLLTGEIVKVLPAAVAEGAPELALEEVLASFPMAMLERI